MSNHPRRAIYVGPPRHHVLSGTTLEYGMTGEVPGPFRPVCFHPDGQPRALLVNTLDVYIPSIHKTRHCPP